MNHALSAPRYWRDRREWSRWLGRKGTVVASTLIHVAPPELAYGAPYPYVLVDFGSEKRSFLGTGHTSFLVGEIVECVWRRMGTPDATGIIPYGIKVQRLSPEEPVAPVESVDTLESEDESHRRSTR
ncbi:OB-fold domain-containing protein [Candidatus Woesebacteria bacterium]|nr:OB-fold domain-containing protein [Candidatus Woesebacteria bacterium]MCD8507686.1 OB-fold domain-containing protein [Candidatus Woesebacteria bacterium]MCD8526731.1 OB-fold domain-containing protein [Candidatus Woesebacteria bacterium]MCD8546527.1 OB-fold domain-containing protein [Candidatus Woesebacteria bacterium]